MSLRQEVSERLPVLREEYAKYCFQGGQGKSSCLEKKRQYLRHFERANVESYQPEDSIKLNLDLIAIEAVHNSYSTTEPIWEIIPSFLTLEEAKAVILDTININCCDRHRQNIKQTALAVIEKYNLEGVDTSHLLS